MRVAVTLVVIFASASLAPAQPLVATGTSRQLTTDPRDQLLPVISGNRVVFMSDPGADSDIHVLDLNSGVETAVASLPVPERLSSIDGDRVVYAEYQPTTGDVRIALHDLLSATTSYLSTGEFDEVPRIAGNLVTWMRGDSTSVKNVVVHDLITGTATEIDLGGQEIYPFPSGTRVVFEARATPITPADIWLYDTTTGAATRLSSAGEDERHPAIDGDLVVWEGLFSDANGVDVMIHDLTTGVTRRLERPGDQRWPRYRDGS